MNSLEWRINKLENKILGQSNRRVETCGTLLQQFFSMADHYESFLQTPGNNYLKFLKLYNIYQNLSLEKTSAGQVELVLAYEDELVNYLQSIKRLADNAAKILDISKWPDLSGFQDRLDKLKTITKEQHLQSNVIDQETENLIDIYNDIIGKFKSNINVWNQRLEAYENEEKSSDDS